MFLKITNLAENHNGMRYRDGLNVDILPFEAKGSCVPGGIYFADIRNICWFMSHGPWVREVRVPKGSSMVKDGEKYRAHKVILGKRKDLREVSTWKWLESCGLDVHWDAGKGLVGACRYSYLEVMKYLVDCGVLINSVHLWNAVCSGDLEIVKYLVEHGADINSKTLNSLGEYIGGEWIFHRACGGGKLEIVKYLVENGADINWVSNAKDRLYSDHIMEYLASK